MSLETQQHCIDFQGSTKNAEISRLLRVAMLIGGLCCALTGCVSAQRNVQDVIYEALRNNEPVPLAHVIDETLTIESAYAIQSYVVRRQWKKTRPAGFKGGLTSAAAQARFGTSEPIAGVLPATGLRSSGITLYLSELRGLNIETEVAFRISKRIVSPLASIAQLQEHVDGIAAAIELPNLHFTTPDQLTPLDLIASNASAAVYVLGDFVSPASRDPNAVTPRLLCNDSEVSRGMGRDALGDQWQAAVWLVNRMLDAGWIIEPGQILLTGALGRMVAAAPGKCVADYGDWGTLEVNVSP